MPSTAWSCLLAGWCCSCFGPNIIAFEPKADVGFGRLQHVAIVHRHSLAGSTCVCLTGDGQHLYATSQDTSGLTAFQRDATGRLEFVQAITSPQELNGAYAARVSPNGRNVLAVAYKSQSLLLLERNPSSGKLVRQHLIHAGRDHGSFRRPADVVFSPDSRFAYCVDPLGPYTIGAPVGRRDCGVVVALSLADGKLSFLESKDGQAGCLVGARRLAMSPSGDALFVSAAEAGAVSTFARDVDSGRLDLRHIACDERQGIRGLAMVAGVTCSPDGRHLYTTSGGERGDNAVSAFGIDADLSLRVIQEVLTVPDFFGGSDLVVSPDGRNVYAAASRSATVACFERDQASGMLDHVETIATGAAPTANVGRPFGMGISPDGQFLYLACGDRNAISIFRRQTD